MNRKDRSKLLGLINNHVKAEVAESWIGSQPPEEHADIESEAARASVGLADFINSLTDVTASDLLIYKLREEIRVLNRAVCRKNKKLKAQYEALHGSNKRPVRVETLGVHFGARPEFSVVDYTPRPRRTGETLNRRISCGLTAIRVPDHLYGFHFTTSEGEPAIYFKGNGGLWTVFYDHTTWIVTAIRVQDDGSRTVTAYSAGFDNPITLTIPKEAFS